jgi:hypothetical protein
MAAEGTEPIGIDGTDLPHICDICSRDLTLCTHYFYCIDCPATFFWCYECFHATSRIIREPGERINPDMIAGRVVTSTRNSHIHRYREFRVIIKTPSKKTYNYK